MLPLTRLCHCTKVLVLAIVKEITALSLSSASQVRICPQMSNSTLAQLSGAARLLYLCGERQADTGGKEIKEMSVVQTKDRTEKPQQN